jgi:hypothetical protein
MRKFLLPFFAVLGVVVLNSCEDKNSEQTNTMAVQLELNDATVQIGSVIETDQGRLSLSDCKLYLSDIYVHYADGDSALWSELVLIDFEENSTLKNVYLPLEVKPIVAVSAGLGLKPEMNEGVDPSEFSPEHPLSFQSSNGMHWGWETGYRFLVFDAVADTGSGNFDWPISYHVGTSDLYKRFTVTTNGGTESPILVENLESLFSEAVLDMKIIDHPQTHTLNNEVVAEKFRDAFISSLSIK